MGAPTFEDLGATAQSPAGHIVQPQSVGKYKEILKAMLGPASYTTGGDTIVAEDLQITWINYLIAGVALSGDRIGHIIYPSNEGPAKSVKLLITDLAGVEVANASNQSTKKFRLIGQGTY